MRYARDLGRLLRRPLLRRLLAVRLAAQLTDGLFQAALGAYALFSPEREPNAATVAAAFAAILLPYSVLGPFTGVFLDRWSRRQVMLLANLARVGIALVLAGMVVVGRFGIPLFLVVLVSLSVSRFFLASLSAALPHTVPARELVLANGTVPTAGTVCYVVGLGVGVGVRAVAMAAGVHTDETADAIVLLAAAGGYLAAGMLALRIGRSALGPVFDPALPAVRAALARVLSGLRDGLRHLATRRPAWHGLVAIGAHRFCYGVLTVMLILLYRNYFYDSAHTSAALSGLAAVAFASGLGYVTAAVLTPIATRAIRLPVWIVVLFAVCAIATVFPAGLYTAPGVVAASFVIGVGAQGIKICVDTLVQTEVDDAYRGRVFAIYDVIFNAVLVAAAALSAVILPVDGRSYAVLGGIAAGFALTAVGYARAAIGDRPTRGSTVGPAAGADDGLDDAAPRPRTATPG